MRKLIKILITIASLFICTIVTTAFINSTDAKSIEFQENENEIYQCIFDGETAYGEIGVIPIKELDNIVEMDASSYSLTKEQKETLTGNAKEKFETFFASGLASNYADQQILAYEEIIKTPQTGADCPNSSVGIRSGILNFKLTNLSIHENDATVGANYVSYHIWLERELDDKYLLTMTMSQYDNIYILKNDGSGWRIAEIPQYQQYFAPDNFETVKGVYTTAEEALDAAAKIIPEEENPF